MRKTRPLHLFNSPTTSRSNTNLALLLMFFARLVMPNVYHLYNDLLTDYLRAAIGALAGIIGIMVVVIWWI